MATQSVNRYQNVVQTIFTLVRILIGWHFLYEGLAKLFSPWSSAGYLMGSQWLFSGVFNGIAENPGLLQVIDLLNIIGLIAVGICLLLGFFTRPASIVGAFLILLYYIANPPFIGYLSETTGEGHYLIVNKQLIEMGVLILFIFLPRSFFWSLDRLLSRIRDRVPADKVEEGPEVASMERRELLKDLIALPFIGGLAWVAMKKKKWESFEEASLVSQPSRVDAISGVFPWQSCLLTE